MSKTAADQEREKRLQFIEHRARQANELSRVIRDLSSTLEKLKAGQGEWKIKTELDRWDHMPGLGSHDNSAIRAMVMQYVSDKLAEKEAEFDRL